MKITFENAACEAFELWKVHEKNQVHWFFLSMQEMMSVGMIYLHFSTKANWNLLKYKISVCYRLF